jgi:hypothetical protein
MKRRRKIPEKVARPLKVDFELNAIDQECGLLGEAGWHTDAIAKEVGITPSQVTYRLGLAGIKRANYRNGRSDMAHFILNIIRARHSAKDRVAEVRQVPDKFENLQEQHVKVCSQKRKLATAGSN